MIRFLTLLRPNGFYLRRSALTLVLGCWLLIPGNCIAAAKPAEPVSITHLGCFGETCGPEDKKIKVGLKGWLEVFLSDNPKVDIRKTLLLLNGAPIPAFDEVQYRNTGNDNVLIFHLVRK